MSKMLVIAPYEGLADLFLEVNKTAKKNIDVEVGNLYKGVMIAKSLEKKGYDVIISRGATGRIIREQSSIPVVDLQISGYDILRTIRLVQGFTGKIGVMSFLNIVQGTDVVGTLLGMEIQTYPVDSEEDIELMVQRAQSDGVDLILGDVITTTIAERYGMNCILITSGREAVLDAMERAEEVAFYTNREQKLKLAYEQVLQSCQDGVIMVDNRAVCLNINEKAASFLDVNKTEFVGEHFNDEVPFLNFKRMLNHGEKEVFHHINLNERMVDIEKFPIKINEEIQGAAILIRESKVEGFLNNFQTDTETRPTIQFSHLNTKSPDMQKLIQGAKKISNSDLPIIINGEEGAGKKSLAQAIHNNSARKDNPFYLINCDELKTEYQIEELFLRGNSSEGNTSIFTICNNGTICFENIHTLPFYHQIRLAKCLKDKKLDNGESFDVRILVLSSKSLSNYVDEGVLSKELFKQVNGFHLLIPPLRKRKEDLKDFVRTFIASANMKTGKQIVSLEDRVLEGLLDYDWPGNITQLKRVIEQMCFISEGPFIKNEEVKEIIQAMYMKNGLNNFSIDISSKTLEVITKEIIVQVLEEENQNQSKAAERLGINRSTLWRKLKTL